MATVVSLDSRRPQPEPTRSCSCKPGHLCYPHRVSNVADVVAAFRRDHLGELLVDVDTVDILTEYVLEHLRPIVSECLPDEEVAR